MAGVLPPFLSGSAPVVPQTNPIRRLKVNQGAAGSRGRFSVPLIGVLIPRV